MGVASGGTSLLEMTVGNFGKAVLIVTHTPVKTCILSPLVKGPDPSPERGGSRDTQNCADQLHVPPTDPD